MDRPAHLAALAGWLVMGTLGCAAAELLVLRDRTAVSIPLVEPDEVWVYRFEAPDTPAPHPPPDLAGLSERLHEHVLKALTRRGIEARSADAFPDQGVPHNLLLVRGVVIAADPGSGNGFLGLGAPESRLETLVWFYSENGEIRQTIQDFETRAERHGLAEDVVRSAELIAERLYRLYVVQAWLPPPSE